MTKKQLDILEAARTWRKCELALLAKPEGSAEKLELHQAEFALRRAVDASEEAS